MIAEKVSIHDLDVNPVYALVYVWWRIQGTLYNKITKVTCDDNGVVYERIGKGEMGRLLKAAIQERSKIQFYRSPEAEFNWYGKIGSTGPVSTLHFRVWRNG